MNGYTINLYSLSLPKLYNIPLHATGFSLHII